MNSQTITLPGVFLSICHQGVLLMGKSGIGKSALALSLVDRGHQLIADDAVTFECTNAHRVIGSCPNELQDQIEIRGFGIVNLKQLYGTQVIKKQSTLNLIIQLEPYQDNCRSITPEFGTSEILQQKIVNYRYAMPTLSSHSVALTIELIVKYHLQTQLSNCPIHTNSFCTSSLGQIL